MTVPISVGTRVRRLRGVSVATYARTVTKPLGTVNGFMGLATPGGAIWTKSGFWFSVFLPVSFPVHIRFLSPSRTPFAHYLQVLPRRDRQ